MPRTIPPQITKYLKEAAISTLCAIISIALSRFGKDPASLFLRAYFLFLFTTIPGWTILALVIAYTLIRRLIKRRRK